MQLTLFNLAWACDELGEVERAQALAQECLRHARAFGAARNVAFALDLADFHAHEEGRLDEALDAALEGLRIRRDEGDVQHELDGISRVAAIHARARHFESATSLLSSSLHLHEKLGMLVPLWQEKRNDETLRMLHEHFDDVAFSEAWEQGTRLTLDEAVELALASLD